MVDALCIDLPLDSDLPRICLVDLIVVAIADFRCAVQLLHIKEIVQCVLIRDAHAERAVDHYILVEIILAAQNTETLPHLSERAGRAKFGVDINARRSCDVSKRISSETEAILCIVNTVADNARIEGRTAAIGGIVKPDVARVRIDALLLICRAALVVVEVDAHAELAVIRAAADIDMLRELALRPVGKRHARLRLCARTLRDEVDCSADRPVWRHAAEERPRPLQNLDVIRILDAAVETRRNSIESIDLRILLLCLEAANHPRLRNRRECQIRHRRVVDNNINDRVRLLILDEFVVKRRDVERNLHKVTLTKHAEMALTCNLPARIDVRTLLCDRLHRRLHGLRYGALSDNLDRIEIIDSFLLRTLRCICCHRQRKSSGRKCHADMARQLLGLVFHCKPM